MKPLYPQLRTAGLTDVGRQRKHNEDHILVRPEYGLFVVADGMGGHSAGDIASALATASLENFFQATTQLPIPEEFLHDLSLDLAHEQRRLIAAIRKANQDILEISAAYPQHHGMGSTIVAVSTAEPGVMHIAHVGDSRCYRFRAGQLEQLTVDHSLVSEALSVKPDITPEELARLPKNIVTRALGMIADVDIDYRMEPICPDDLYLLCSDGLSGMLSEQKIAETLEVSDSPEDACELLIALANDAGGVDNISAVVIQVESHTLPGVTIDELKKAAIHPINSMVERDSLRARRSSNPPPEELESEPPPQITIARCQKCRAEILLGNEFCVECGAKVPS